MSERFDVIVCGAGPAGSTTARLLAGQGARVLMLDRASFPRDKPCGGGVTIRAAAAVSDVDLSPVIERSVYGARVTFRLKRPFERRHPRPLTHMTQRRHLDAYLADLAACAGVCFRDGVAVREVEVSRGGATVRAGGDVYRATIVVAADGANGVAARACGLAPVAHHAVALEGNLPAQDALMERWADVIGLDLGGIAGGYGWVFPKGDHLNVGVGGWNWTAPSLRRKLSALCHAYGFDEARLENVRGYRLPMRGDGAPLLRGPALAVGDAAGLVDPLSGEGIGHALESGALAAEAIARYLRGETLDLRDYERAVDERIMPEIRTSWRLTAIFHRIPWACTEVMRRSDRFWTALCRIVEGEKTYDSFRRSLGPLRLILDAWGDWGAARDARRT